MMPSKVDAEIARIKKYFETVGYMNLEIIWETKQTYIVKDANLNFILDRGDFISGVPHGRHTQWVIPHHHKPNFQLGVRWADIDHRVGTYENGKPIGEWFYFLESGECYAVESCENGKTTGVIFWKTKAPFDLSRENYIERKY